MKTPDMTTPSDNSWFDVGPGLGGVAAEAVCAYEMWRAASRDMDVSWVSGYGHDVEVATSDGRTVRVNRAWEDLWGLTLDQLGDYDLLADPQLEAKGTVFARGVRSGPTGSGPAGTLVGFFAVRIRG